MGKSAQGVTLSLGEVQPCWTRMIRVLRGSRIPEGIAACYLAGKSEVLIFSFEG
jgi:hypothetical protein